MFSPLNVAQTQHLDLGLLMMHELFLTPSSSKNVKIWSGELLKSVTGE